MRDCRHVPAHAAAIANRRPIGAIIVGPTLFVAVMFVGQLSATWGFSTLPAVLDDVQAVWRLTNTQAGFLNGVFFFGLATATPLLTGLTDRFDPKRIYLWSMALCGLAQLGFAYAADGFIGGTLWRFLYGVGFAGTYMPGLKIVSDTVPAAMQSRAVAIYTATMPTGTGLSFFLSGMVAERIAWQDSIALLASGSLIALALAVAFMPAGGKGTARGGLLPNVRPAFTNRQSLGHIVAYFAHQLETSTTRAFAVVFLLFAIRADGGSAGGGFDWIPATVVGFATILGLPVMLIADQLSRRVTPRTMIPAIMLSGAVLGVALGFSLGAPYAVVAALMVAYGIAATADGGLINAGLIASTGARNRGGVMAAHSAIGFTGALLGPVLFGLALDLGGGQSSPSAWFAGFAAIAAVIVVCAAVSRLLTR